jgi:hypothetical protein
MSFGHVINPLQNYSRTMNLCWWSKLCSYFGTTRRNWKGKLIIVDPHTSNCIWVTSYVNSCDLRYSFTLDWDWIQILALSLVLDFAIQLNWIWKLRFKFDHFFFLLTN